MWLVPILKSFSTWNCTYIFLLPQSEALRKVIQKSLINCHLHYLPFLSTGSGGKHSKVFGENDILFHSDVIFVIYYISNLDCPWIYSLILLIETLGIKKSVIRSLRRNTLQIGNYALSIRISKQLPYPFPHLMRLISPSLFFFFLNDQLKI